MKFHKYLSRFFLFFAAFPVSLSFAQDMPIGYWRSHMPYNKTMGVANKGTLLFAACSQGFFSFDNANGDMTPYSKVSGMSDIGAKNVAYDAATETVVIAYENSNIDLFYPQTNSFFNVPDLKIKVVSESKTINDIYIEAGLAYLSTDLGVIVLDITDKNIRETYHFIYNNQNIAINAFIGLGDYFYAATNYGLYRANKSSPQLQNYAVWQRIDSTHSFKKIAEAGNSLFLANDDSVFVFKNDTTTFLHKSVMRITHLDAVASGVWICEYNDTLFSGLAKKISLDYQFTDSSHFSGKPLQIVELPDGSLWIADALYGLRKRTAADETGVYIPTGPLDPTCNDVYVYNKDVWVSHPNGISNLENSIRWSSKATYQYYPFGDSVNNFVAIAKNRLDSNVYFGSYTNGLFILKTNYAYEILKQNSILEHSLSNIFDYSVSGLNFDNDNNLWLTMYGSPHQLYEKTSDGTWYKYSISYPHPDPYPYDADKVITDDYGQAWFNLKNGGGVVVFNNNGTPGNISDDRFQQLVTGESSGNLPSNTALCLAKDNNGEIWIGTDDGVATVNLQGTVFSNTYSANIPTVQYDQYAGYLFKGERVNTIAVDGANRKWVGTNNGVWLLSSDASYKIIYRFTKDNSPLPSNIIKKIAVDPVTGDVYIGSDQGLMSYRSTAIEGTTTNQHVITFPNPVPSGYKGTVAIKGLVTNGDVRITDISGQLVYRTTALGGQAVWNGMDYTGHRPSSGVYLIFVANKDGSQTFAGKMVFIQ